MSALKYKTRGMANPQGLPRVYFSCHPSDFDTYFDEISNEILKKQNCAIYYDEELGMPYDEEQLLSDLSQMQLFVMPVTTRLLTQKNRALELEFAFAMKEHIPVLPLMQESGLEEVFNKKCGDLQFLSKNHHDAAGISYSEKLGKYLSTVLIGDEMAAKVRAAFDAYIFLSYRKKDRKYAQELMRLIHKNDFCRDIAIWYDEFLTPGENFNDAISDALKKSELFTLVVTPNLVNEVNYIMTTEYPMAKVANKPILPAEVVPTDQEELNKKYENIPMCTDARNEAELSEALLKAVQSMSIQENDKNLEHDFFIGLAYLSGIDVEVDKERAVELITSSAEAGLVEAIEKLVQMYYTGEGVKRNYDTAVMWQEKLVEQLERKYIESNDLKDGYAFETSVSKLGDYLYEIRKMEKAKAAFRRLKIFCKENMTDSGSDYWWFLFVSYQRLGEIEKKEGNLKQSKEYYEKSLQISLRMQSEMGTLRTYRDVSISYESLGEIEEKEGHLRKAREYYLKSWEIRKKLKTELGTIRTQSDLAWSYDSLGDIEKEEGDPEEAKAYYMKGLEIREKLAAELETAEAFRELSISYERLGDIEREERNLDKAEVYYEKSLDIAKRLVIETETLLSNEDLATGCDKLGQIEEAKENLEKAEEYYRKGLEIREKLSSIAGNADINRQLVLSYSHIGDIEKKKGNIESAKEYYKKGLEIREQLAGEAETVESIRDLSWSYCHMGEIEEEEGHYEKARAYYEKGLKIREKWTRENMPMKMLRDMFVIYIKLGNIESLEKAKEYYKKALEISLQCAQEGKNVEISRDLSISYERLGDVEKAGKNLEEAKKYYKKVLKIREELVIRTKTLESYRDLSIGYEKLGEIEETERNLEEAKKYYKKALEISQKLADETRTIGSYDDLAVSYYKIGSMYPFDISLLEEAFRIWNILSEHYPNKNSFVQRRDMVKRLIKEIISVNTKI